MNNERNLAKEITEGFEALKSIRNNEPVAWITKKGTKEMTDYDPNDAIDFIFKTAPAYAKAKGELAQLEAFKSSLKAIKMAQTDEQSLGAQEREAYRSQEYQDLCKAIGLATEQAEAFKWQLTAAQLRVEIWRTDQANNRNIERLTK